jgi:alkylation response protein AidB-like acyl-CoA dehydrogenase
MDMEKPGSPAIELFRKAGGPGLLIPARFGGRGATPLQAARVQRAIGSRSPSLAIAATMHHFSTASVVELAEATPGTGEQELALIAAQNLYLASGFAEGRTGTSVLSSNMEVRRASGGLVLNGSKKPCSLSASMDIFTTGVFLPTESGVPQFAVVTVLAGTPGLERRPFWGNAVLAGAESDEVVLRDVFVPDEQVFLYRVDDVTLLERAFLWFELLISASYLGVASALVERVLAAGRGTPAERTRLATEVEGAMAGLECVARAMGAGERDNDTLAQSLFVRYSTQGAIERAVSLAGELLGGMAFVKSSEVGYLIAAATALAFHPPSRLSVAPALDAYLSGEPLVMS